jgi:hypothetical protein
MRDLALGLVLLASCGGELAQEGGGGSSHSSASEGGTVGAECCVGASGTGNGTSTGASTSVETGIETGVTSSTAIGHDEGGLATSSSLSGVDACTALGSCCLMIGFNNEPACGAAMQMANNAFCSTQLAVFSDAGLCGAPP